MNNLRNSVRLIGHLGNAPEIKTVDNGNKMAKLSIATNDFYTDKNGEKQTETIWHNLVAWGKTAELVEQLLHKGTEVAIEGKLNSRSYEKEGEKKYVTEVVVNDFAVFAKKTS